MLAIVRVVLTLTVEALPESNCDHSHVWDPDPPTVNAVTFPIGDTVE